MSRINKDETYLEWFDLAPTEDEAGLVEEVRLKAEQEDQAYLKAEDKACLFEDARQEEKEYEHPQLKVE